jgi:hypothetical protein
VLPRRTTLLLLCLPLALASGLLPSGPAFAQDEEENQTGAILFSAQGVDPSQSSRFGDVLRRTMKVAAKEGLQIPSVADLDRRNDGMLVIEAEQHLIDATKYFQRGLKLLQQDRKSNAFEEFERSLHFYRNAYPYAQDERLYTDIVFYVSEASQGLKGTTKRESDFHRCEAVGLTIELTGAVGAIDQVNEFYPECEWEIEDPENRELEVGTNPQGARVYVDGQFRGVTPLKLTNLRAGEHVFTFVREGYRRVSRILRIGEKFAETRELEMGLHLKPGVYQAVYKDLIPVVQGAAADEEAVLTKAADTLQVTGLLLVLVTPGTDDQVTVYTLNWPEKGKPTVRNEFKVDLRTPDQIEESVVKILAGVYSVDASNLPALAERSPIYFKLELPPFTPEEEY